MKYLSGMDRDDSIDIAQTPIYRNLKTITYLKRGRFEFDKDGKIVFVEDESGCWIVSGSK